MSRPADIIDLLAGLTPAAPLSVIRDQRAQARENAQRSFEALLEPADPGTFPLAERYAVAAFVARLHGFDAAVAFYSDLLDDEDPALGATVAAVADAASSAASSVSVSASGATSVSGAASTAVAGAASATDVGAIASTGPYGVYRESGLQGENREGLRWHPSSGDATALGTRLSAALAHTHLLVFRPREARPEALQALVDAGWSADDIVTLSQLVAFLSFQLRAAWGLRVLAASGSASAAEVSAEFVAEGV